MSFAPGQTEQPALFNSHHDGATFSPCRTWRYDLWRRWGEGPMAAFVLLNPSSATEMEDDPTIRRCIGFAKRWNMAGIHILNIFALRATDPAHLYRAPDPVGPDNDRAIFDIASRCQLIVCGWGNHGILHGRGQAVAEMLSRFQPQYLALNQTGEPRHPLYVRYSTRLQPLPTKKTAGSEDPAAFLA